VPLPAEPDEFSYLLAADTFARGRLTNPPHPMADALEYADALQRPTYASKHPPAQGAVLALGTLATGLPIVGVWITGAIGCAAITWMMRTFAPPAWALLAGVLASLHPLIATWNNSYWGGNVALIGGAIALGATLRMTRRARPRDGIVAGIGLSILALSRPFEGALFALVLAIISIRRLRLRVLPFALTALIPALVFLAYYNSRVTGDWQLFPHRLHQEQSLIIPRFIWEQPRLELPFISKFMRDFAMIEYDEYQQHIGVANVLTMGVRDSIELIGEYFTPAMLLLAALAAMRARERRTRTALIVVVALPLIHMMIIPITRVPYFAMLLGAIFVLVIAGMRCFPPALRSLAVAVTLTTQVAAYVHELPAIALRAHEPPAVRQTQEIERLAQIPGKHLVLVDYVGDRQPLYDFVHNGAEIDHARIVFARSLDPQRDRATLEYFADRTVWLLTYDGARLSIEPLTESR
jgi:hypothetical protein